MPGKKKPAPHKSKSKPPLVPSILPDGAVDLSDLPLKQQALLTAYATPGSPTFGNKTRSAAAAGYSTQSPSALRVQASQVLARPNLQARLSSMLRAQRLTTKDRLAVTADVMHERHNVTEYYGADGELRQRVVTSAAKDRLRAVDLVNRIDGTYDRNRATAEASRHAFEKQLDMYTKLLREAIKAPVQGDGEQPLGSAQGQPSESTSSEQTGTQAQPGDGEQAR